MILIYLDACLSEKYSGWMHFCWDIFPVYGASIVGYCNADEFKYYIDILYKLECICTLSDCIWPCQVREAVVHPQKVLVLNKLATQHNNFNDFRQFEGTFHITCQ